MLLNRENKENRQVVLTIQVERDPWEKALNEAYEQSKNLFKKEDGSLPTRQEMEEKHGADVFYQDAVNSTFPVALVEAVRQEDISVAGAPELSVESIGPDGYVFTALIDLYPEVKLGQYKGLSAPRPTVELSDDDVTAAIEEYLQNHLAEEHPKKAAMGDEVVLDFEGFVNGVPFEGGKAEQYPLLLGSGYFIPGFEEQVAGMAVGDERDIAVTFPAQYAPELAGKDAVFHIKVHKITRRVKPVMDDAFAKAQGFADASALRRSIASLKTYRRRHLPAAVFLIILLCHHGLAVRIQQGRKSASIAGLDKQIVYARFLIHQNRPQVGKAAALLGDHLKALIFHCYLLSYYSPLAMRAYIFSGIMGVPICASSAASISPFSAYCLPHMLVALIRLADSHAA